MTAKPKSALKPNSPRAPTRIADTSPSSRAAISSVLTASSHLRAARSAAALRSRFSLKPAVWPTSAIREIQLLGQIVNSYRDPSRKKSFAELLTAVAEVPGIRRVRFTTSHPRYFTRDIVEAIDAVPTLCDHVHLPVQSGSTRILNAMQRLYTRDEYLERISWIKAARRQISITSDIIVGFPGETEADFDTTLSLLDEVGYDSIFGFKYSPRPNTPSLKLEDAIPEEEKSRRLAVLQEKQRQIQRQRNSNQIHQTIEVMVEGKNEARNQWIGRTSQNKTLNFTSPNGISPQVGSYVPVVATASFPNSLLGEMVI